MGGHAFTDTIPLDRNRADAVIAELRDRTGWDLEPVGSYGRKQRLPDLDLIVPESQFDAATLRGLGLTKKYGLGGAGLRWQDHQVDFFPVVSLEWGRFARSGADDSGAIRALLLKAAASTYEEPGKDFHVWRDDVAMIRAGRTLDQRYGLRRIYQHRMKLGGGFLKNAKTVDRDSFNASFRMRMPGVPVITNPDEVQRMILGGVGHADTARGLWSHIKASFSPERVRRVRAKLKERGVTL